MSFSQLQDAVAFLAVRLDEGDADAIADQCTDAAQDSAAGVNGLPARRTYRLAAIGELRRQHGLRSLRSTYEHREFPVDADVFKLGGHGAELGHVHVDFARTGESWRLKEIWICR